ncbi:hypothetical protein VTK73DRAFT_921 [Phialemonium thermophilum]|uniref:ferric-chelate reductase (NADPH) n=1 Tax=Phialemonium thermophilum TaxID=223376 RepID=A0ABR3XC11_9PEZI
MDMSMSSGTNMFQKRNMSLAEAFWYIIAGVCGLGVVIQAVEFYKARLRLRRRAASSVEFPTKPSNRFLASWATLTAVVREASYPQFYVPVRWLSWMTPPPMGRIAALLIYWAIVIYMMTDGSIVIDYNFYERLGFRNAWVTVMQVPLLYLLATKANVLGLLVGVSYERLNWFHRWVGRTMLVTASVHGWHFYAEYYKAGLVEDMIEMMPMIKYGLGAWGILLWTLIVSFAPIRQRCYELFVLQHILSAVLFLWLIYVHVPDYARYNVWFAIAALCFDRAYRTVLLVWQNIKFRVDRSRCQGGRRIGHEAQVRAVGDSITVVTIKDAHFQWRAGQHLYLWMPRLGLLEAHPYTIACAHQLPETCICNSIQLVVRKHDGFSKRLHAYATKAMAAGRRPKLTAFISGPYGMPPRWDIYENVVLVSASTGASFTLPILESIVQTRKTICTKRVDFLLAAKQDEEIDFYVTRLHELIESATEVGIELSVHIAVTRGGKSAEREVKGRALSAISSASSSASGVAEAEMSEKAIQTSREDVEKSAMQPRRARVSTASTDSHVHYLDCRPDVEAFIRAPVEAAGGETSVIVCGGKSLVARVRNTVAALSDERAVHKGTGAQGIHLYVEEYCF